MANDLLFTKENTLFQATAHTWEEAVRISGNLLIKQGKANVGYVEGIINAVKKNGPYIVIAEGIAIPHSRPEDGALGTGCALITLKEPVYFDNDESPVRVLISFSAVDNDNHIDILQTVVRFIEQDLIKKIERVDDYEEFMKLQIKIERKEKV